MNDKAYTIGQVANILKTETHTIRYIESILELESKRDNNYKRYYNSEDISQLETILNLREQGLNYAAIKSVLNAKKEIAASARTEPEVKSNLPMNPKNIDQLALMLQNIISNNMSNIISPGLNKIESKLDALSKQNDQLMMNMERQQEKHFKELDAKLTMLREEKKALHKEPWYLRIFKKKKNKES